MNSEFGDKLQQAIAASQNVNTYVWKGPKVNGTQKEFKLIDQDAATLAQYLEHCNQMLYNKNEKNPGRLTLLDIVYDQMLHCRAELLVRWLKNEKGITKIQCYDAIRQFVDKNKENYPDISKYPVKNLMTGLPSEFEDVPIYLVQAACLDALGTFNNSHLTLNFIIRMGLWFTQKEMQTPYPEGLYLKDPNTGKAANRLELVKKELNLNPAINLKVIDTGISYSEFKSMCKLRRSKYSELSDEQLSLLSDKVLYRFQNQCEEQAKQWQEKIREIREVAAHKGYNLD